MTSLAVGSTLQNGKYKILKVLGQGGFGITYLAVHTILEINVAIKEFFPKSFCDREEKTNKITLGTTTNSELVERFKTKFIKEARNIAKLKHPGIIRIQDVFEDNNTAYYVMDYINGKSLADIVARDGHMQIPKAIELITKVGDAISYIHSKNINHLDIKPANIMLDNQDNPILIDFGLAKQYDVDGEETSTTPVGISHGYAPLEQYSKGGVSTFSPQADIYSLGATLYKLITGSTPPEAIELLESELTFPSYIDEMTIRAINTAMVVSKGARPNSVDEFIQLLNCSNDTIQNSDNETIIVNNRIKKFPARNVSVSTNEYKTKININGVVFNMIRVKGGSLHMQEPNGWLNIFNQPSQYIELSDYEIGQTPVTQSLWDAIMGHVANPSCYIDGNKPVDSVSYHEAIHFINKLNELSGLKFSLPTEAQWEYAAKGGINSNGFRYSGSNDINEVAWVNSKNGTYAVGQKKSNELGIFDMSGNVEEWCLDWYKEYKHISQKNYSGPKSGEKKVLRGGSFYHHKSVAEVSFRQSAYPESKEVTIGFRLVRKL